VEKVEKIIERYLDSEKVIDTDRQALIDTKIKRKSSEEIATYLTKIPPEEVGGLTAVSGFYYQFLVTIEYIVQMLDGKWDYVIMEHHDDVVVGKENKIRFIQVKTSGKVKVDVTESPASGLYLRGAKSFEGVSLKRNNSWVDKLLMNAGIAPVSDEFETQFQLYSSYHFIKTRDYNLDIYTDNKEYNKQILADDHLYKKLSEPAFDKDGERYSFEEGCGETLSQLLARFYIHTGLPLSDIELFKHHLCMKLNNWLFKDIGPGITMQVEDLHMLIGLLCTKCTYKNNAELLLITRESVEEILSEIRTRSIAAASSAANKHDSIRVTNKVIEALLEDIDDTEHIDFIKDKVYTYREYLVEWISNGGDIRQIIERYIDGTTRTSIYSRLNSTKRETRLQELFNMVLILIVSRDSYLQFTNNNGLLSKTCVKTEAIFSFLGLEKKKSLESALQKVKSIIYSGDLKDHLLLIDKELSIIIQNYNDRDFTSSRKLVLNKADIDVQGLQEEAKLNKVPLTANIIPGEMLKADFLDSLEEETDFQNRMKNIWRTYNGEEN
jgi:hypothetical protein